jgi:hypothetical protein
MVSVSELAGLDVTKGDRGVGDVSLGKQSRRYRGDGKSKHCGSY